MLDDWAQGARGADGGGSDPVREPVGGGRAAGDPQPDGEAALHERGEGCRYYI